MAAAEAAAAEVVLAAVEVAAVPVVPPLRAEAVDSAVGAFTVAVETASAAVLVEEVIIVPVEHHLPLLHIITITTAAAMARAMVTRLGAAADACSNWSF